MTLLEYKIIAALLIFIMSVLAVIYPIKVRAYPKHHSLLELGDAFASGIFLGAALFHMLPDAEQEFTALYQTHYPIAQLLCAGGFLILLFLQRLSHLSALAQKSINSIPYMLTIILIIHALIEGAALGVNTTLATTTVIFFAVIAHKSSESFALAIILNRSSLSLAKILTIVGIFSLMTPLGIGVGTYLTDFVSSKQYIIAGFNAFAAGTFLYMSTLHHINHHERQHEAEGLLEFFALLVGILIMATVALWT